MSTVACGTTARPGRAWKSLGDVDLTGGITLVNVDAAGVRLVATTMTGTIKTALYSTDGTLSAWVTWAGT